MTKSRASSQRRNQRKTRLKSQFLSSRTLSMVSDENGTGVVGTMFGALVFLSFVALAAHTMLGLYATSVVKTIAWDQARRVAADHGQLSAADMDLQERLSGMSLLNRSWDLDDPAIVRLTIAVERPSVLPASLARATSITTIEQTVVVRKEQLR